jgi:acetyltransferase-like isoleucine patch superfamily enzyme
MNLWGKIKLRRVLAQGGASSLDYGRFGSKGTARMRSGYIKAAGPVKVGWGAHVVVEAHYGEGGASLHLGERVKIGHECSIRANCHVSIGSDVTIEAGARIADSLDAENVPFRLRKVSPIYIADGVRIGSGATILPGARVDRDVDPGEVFAGVKSDY